MGLKATKELGTQASKAKAQSTKADVADTQPTLDKQEHITQEIDTKETKAKGKKSDKAKSTKALQDELGDKTSESSPKTSHNKTRKEKELAKETDKAANKASQMASLSQMPLAKTEQVVENSEKNAPEESSEFLEHLSHEPNALEGKGTKANAKNPSKTSSLTQSLAALEANAIKEGKERKDSKEDRRGGSKSSKADDKAQGTQKSDATKANALDMTTLNAQEIEGFEGEEKKSFAELFLENGGKKKSKEKEREKEEGIKESKTAQRSHTESTAAREAQRTQILYRSSLARESVRNFAQSLREEILNYKPPITKLSLELNPQNLGTLELTITKKGKDLHVQVISNSAAIGLFMQNQTDFKNNLAQIGFENVDLSFSANDGGGGKNQGSQGENSSQNDGFSESSEPEGNKNSLEELSSGQMQMNIVLPKYA